MKAKEKKNGLFRRLFRPWINLYERIEERVRKNIRYELIVAFGICLISAIIVFNFVNTYYGGNRRDAYIDYSRGINEILNNSNEIANEISGGQYGIDDKDKIQKIINNMSNNSNGNKIMVTNLDGKVLYKSDNISETQIDIFSLMKTTMNTKMWNYTNNTRSSTKKSSNDDRNEFVSIYPVNLKDSKAYLILKGIPQGNLVYENRNETTFLAVLATPITFILLFLYITRKKMDYLKHIADGLIEISKGNLEHRVKKTGEDELSVLADNINYMAEELQNQIERERKTERTKSELITNVSHDLRTPLTSIMGYLGLIKNKKYENEQQMDEYLDIAFNKSEKLKELIEDLFQYTKLNNKGIQLHKEEVALNEFLEQLSEEFVPIFEENNLILIKDITKEKVIINVDINMILRLLENLLMNAVKYSHKPSNVVMKLIKADKEVTILIKNKGDNIQKEDLDKLFDRFYRMDKARNSESGGSGLGLAISKSIVEIHGGKIWAECEGEDITFVVKFFQ